MGVEKVELIEIDSAGEGPLLEAGLRRAEAVAHRDPYAGTYSFVLGGWALARDGEPVQVQLREGSVLVKQTEARLETPEVAKRHPEARGAETCGFQTVVGTVGLPVEFELAVLARTSEGGWARIGTVRGRRTPLHTGYEPRLLPLLMTTMGRSGSNWLLTLLAVHPDVIAYRPFQVEARLAGYWTGVLRTLGDPTSYMLSLYANTQDERWWMGNQVEGAAPVSIGVPEMPQWLGSIAVEELAAICQGRIDAFYTRLVELERSEPGARQPRYFAEKALPGRTGRMIRELYPGGHEIALVRDLRDVACSVIDYNAKRGISMWGLDGTVSDQDWFTRMRRQALRLVDAWRDGAVLVRYEDLIADPDPTLTKLLGAIGLDDSRRTVKQVLKDAGKLMPKAQVNHQTSPSVRASVGRWKRDLSPERQAVCAEAFDDVLAQFGYEATERR